MSAMVSSHRSTLNPNAPIFVPAVYRGVEDFSPQWWDLVKTCSWFRDYWLSLHPYGDAFQEEEDDDDDVVFEFGDDLADAELEDVAFEDLLDGFRIGSPLLNVVKTDVKALLKDVIVPKSPKPKAVSPRSTAGIPKYQMKTAYCVSPKCTPRRINQPR